MRPPKRTKAEILGYIESDEERSDDDVDNGTDVELPNTYAKALLKCATAGSKSIDSSTTTKTKKKRRENFYIKAKEEELNATASMDEIEKQIAFCCYNCTCPTELKISVDDNETQGVLSAGIGSLYHRRCCHNAIKWNNTWKSPLEKALRDSEPSTEEEWLKLGEPKFEWKETNKDHLQKLFANAKRRESEMYNDDGLPDQASILNANEDYVKNRKEFNRRVKRISDRGKREPAVVLNLFGGIGSAIVALKRLGISISKIIHVEHDKVANHVFRWNHDLDNNEYADVYQNSNRSQKYDIMCFETFDTFLEDMENGKLNTHIDIVIGSPPASDFSGVNSKREGVHGRQGHYMIELGKMISTLQKTQDRPVYFLVVNTMIRNQKTKDLKDTDLEQIKDAFRLTWSIQVDAADVSPCKRKSSVFSNIPYEMGFAYSGENPTVSASTCFEDGYIHPATLFQKDLDAKVHCFSASKKALDDDRMSVAKKEKGQEEKGKKSNYIYRSIRVSEREKLMGFPLGYVSLPVKDLYSCILDKGFNDGLQVDGSLYHQNYWKFALPTRYHQFSGNYHCLNECDQQKSFKFKAVVGQNIELMLTPPVTTVQPDHYTEEQYAKRLIGNAFSIPVITELLKPLRMIFAECSYEGYNYEFEWMKKN